ncbi:Uncharacterised protein [Legionella lansingensis]|uniref:Uncharacterized protein n=1 Tax=Legionella lansingensis TaxID=45067 RepID=A0A0W0VG14_9GAMM|nr:hypothetical protein [Legionella lansingensis]KTD18726.1 hypothetical protein Llan_2329 [Legionella lansingensis]SNV58202.1 Uncharacterised protein [Legionella lansingensis]
MSSPRQFNTNYFLEQYERVKRWYDRCNNISRNDKGSAEHCDDYLAFFININHLKDWVDEWLKKEKKNKLLKQLESQIKGDINFEIIRVICNGSKHFNLTRKNYSIPRRFSIFREYNILNKTHEHCAMFLVNNDFVKYRLSDLAYHAINFWNCWFLQNNFEKLRNKISSHPYEGNGYIDDLTVEDKVRKELIEFSKYAPKRFHVHIEKDVKKLILTAFENKYIKVAQYLWNKFSDEEKRDFSETVKDNEKLIEFLNNL